MDLSSLKPKKYRYFEEGLPTPYIGGIVTTYIPGEIDI